MTFTKKRYTFASLLALVVATVPMILAPAPAHASTYCEYFYGPTPSAEVDLNDDGIPEVRVPSVSDVSICAQDDVFVHGQQLHLEHCYDWFGIDCFRLYVHAQAGVTIDGGLTLCREIDDVRTCSAVDVGPWTYWTPDVNRICIGFDINGSRPCTHGGFVGFE